MVKAITCIRRKPGMSVEAFQEYWRTTHARVASAIPRREHVIIPVAS